MKHYEMILLGFLSCIHMYMYPLSNKYVIGHWPGGMGICLTSLLNHLVYCENAGLTPVVFWKGCYFNPAGFNGKFSEWEYYFQPISSLSYQPHDVINHFCPTGGGSFNYYDLSDAKRELASRLLQKYVHLNAIVQRKVDSFCRTFIDGRHTIAIHMRGTDKYTEEKPVPAEKMVEQALSYADNDTQFFLASDEQQLLNTMIKLLKGHKVIYYDCYRSTDGKPLHSKVHKSKPAICQLGEDVIVEMWLMSHCEVLIHTRSNVSSIPLYLNPFMLHEEVVSV